MQVSQQLPFTQGENINMVQHVGLLRLDFGRSYVLHAFSTYDGFIKTDPSEVKEHL